MRAAAMDTGQGDIDEVRSPAIRSVLVVEDWAHQASGHFPNRFAELADGFRQAGVEVAVLTSLGWAREATGEAPWPVHQYRGLARVLFRLAERGRGASGGIRRVSRLVRTAVMVQQARRWARTMGSGPVAIVSVCIDAMPAVVGLIGGRHPWVVHLFGVTLDGSRTVRLADGIRSRRARSGRPVVPVTVAIPADPVPSPAPVTFDVRHLPLAGTRPVGVRGDARQLLGIPEGRPIALFFGSQHGSHDPRPILEVFRDRADWQLLAGGQAARVVAATRPGSWTVPPVLLDAPDGFVDERTRELAYQAADLVVLSFHDGYRRNSGTLMDAASHERPVLVSSGSAAAELVGAWGCGVVFEAGSAASLGAALDGVDLAACRARMASMRVACSNRTVAEAHLRQLNGEGVRH